VRRWATCTSRFSVWLSLLARHTGTCACSGPFYVREDDHEEHRRALGIRRLPGDLRMRRGNGAAAGVRGLHRTPPTQTGGASAITGGPHAGGAQAAQGTGGSTSNTVTSKSSLSACSWPAELDGDPTSREHCHAVRRSLECTNTNGIGESCTPDSGVTNCGDPAATCRDHCALDEYVASCGSVGPGPVPDPPSGCKFAGAIPAGIAFYCCPCGS
jgi:hypothetical protein